MTLKKGGYSGSYKTLGTVSFLFFWEGMKGDIMRECDVCQRVKSEYENPGGLMHPLSIPSSV